MKFGTIRKKCREDSIKDSREKGAKGDNSEVEFIRDSDNLRGSYS